jgi:hypothetical protein
LLEALDLILSNDKEKRGARGMESMGTMVLAQVLKPSASACKKQDLAMWLIGRGTWLAYAPAPPGFIPQHVKKKHVTKKGAVDVKVIQC